MSKIELKIDDVVVFSTESNPVPVEQPAANPVADEVVAPEVPVEPAA